MGNADGLFLSKPIGGVTGYSWRLLHGLDNWLIQRDFALKLRVGGRATDMDGEAVGVGVPGEGFLVIPGEASGVEGDGEVTGLTGVKGYAGEAF
jgi:hypothetical protein